MNKHVFVLVSYSLFFFARILLHVDRLLAGFIIAVVVELWVLHTAKLFVYGSVGAGRGS